MANEEFVKLINTPSATVVSSLRTYEITNRNRMLREFEGMDGVKTGFTNKAGYCFVGSAERDGMRLISVVLASGWGAKGKEQKWTDTKRILTYGFAEFEYETIIKENAEAGEVGIERSKTDKITVVFERGLTLPLTDEERAELKIESDLPESLRAPVMKGDVVGKAKIIVNDEVYDEIEILATSFAERHDFKTSMEKVFNELMEMLTVKDMGIVLPEFSLPWE
jgi:D-alanyl-D-alanine carboxypeptidase (penicillin-binding protein 5/6)